VCLKKGERGANDAAKFIDAVMLKFLCPATESGRATLLPLCFRQTKRVGKIQGADETRDGTRSTRFRSKTRRENCVRVMAAKLFQLYTFGCSDTGMRNAGKRTPAKRMAVVNKVIAWPRWDHWRVTVVPQIMVMARLLILRCAC
jgi:hypothetical protein